MEEQGLVSASCSENQGPMILGISYSLLAIAIITVILRLHLRFGLRHGIKSDDYTMVASLVSRRSVYRWSMAMADYATGRCHHWNWVFDQIGCRRTREAYLVLAFAPITPDTEMEHHRSDLERYWHRLSKDIGVPLCAEDHR